MLHVMIVVKPDVISAVFCSISIQKEVCTIFRYLATIVAVGCKALSVQLCYRKLALVAMKTVRQKVLTCLW